MSRERKKIVAHIHKRADEIAAGPTHTATAEERSVLSRRLKAIAGEIEQGFHL